MSERDMLPRNVIALPQRERAPGEEERPENYFMRTARKPTHAQREARFDAQAELARVALKHTQSPTSMFVFKHSNMPDILNANGITYDEALGYVGQLNARQYLPALSEGRHTHIAQAIKADIFVSQALQTLMQTVEMDRAYIIQHALSVQRPLDKTRERGSRAYGAVIARFLEDTLKLSPKDIETYFEEFDAVIDQMLPPREAPVIDLRPDPRGRRVKAKPAPEFHQNDILPEGKDDERRWASAIVLEAGAPATMRLLHTKQIMEYLDETGIDPNDMLAYATLAVAIVNDITYDEENVRGMKEHHENDPRFAKIAAQLQDALRHEEDHAFHYIREALKPEIPTRQRENIIAGRKFQHWCAETLNLNRYEFKDFINSYHIALNNELARMGKGGEVGIGIGR